MPIGAQGTDDYVQEVIQSDGDIDRLITDYAHFPWPFDIENTPQIRVFDVGDAKPIRRRPEQACFGLLHQPLHQAHRL